MLSSENILDYIARILNVSVELIFLFRLSPYESVLMRGLLGMVSSFST